MLQMKRKQGVLEVQSPRVPKQWHWDLNPGLSDRAKEEKPAARLGDEVRPSQVLGCECSGWRQAQ